MITHQTTSSVPAHRGWILFACMMAMFMAAIEVTIVATAMPSIIADLGGFASLGWVFSIYLLMQAVTIPIYGRLADLFGRKAVFIIGAGLFMAGSIMCGFSGSMWWLIVFRGLQGLGAGAITPLTTTIIADIYTPQERARVQGYLSSVWAVSAIIGPLMGAFIVSHYHWSGVFWINIPLGILSVILLMRFLPPSQQPEQSVSLDWAGIGYLTLAVCSLLIALLQASELGYLAIGLLLVALMSAILLVRQERRAVTPLFPLALWKSQVIVAGNLGGLVIGAAMMGIAAFLPTYIQAVLGGSTLQAGWTLAMMSIGWPLASTLSGRIMMHTSYRLTAVCGAVLLILGSVLLLQLSADSAVWFARLAAFVIGLGMGTCNTTFLVSVQNDADYAIRGIATASTLFTRMVGSAVGTAVFGAVFNLNLAYRLPQIADPVRRLIEQHSRHQTDSTISRMMIEQVALSLHWVFWCSAIIAVFALIPAMMIRTSKQYGSQS